MVRILANKLLSIALTLGWVASAHALTGPVRSVMEGIPATRSAIYVETSTPRVTVPRLIIPGTMDTTPSSVTITSPQTYFSYGATFSTLSVTAGSVDGPIYVQGAKTNGIRVDSGGTSKTSTLAPDRLVIVDSTTGSSSIYGIVASSVVYGSTGPTVASMLYNNTPMAVYSSSGVTVTSMTVQNMLTLSTATISGRLVFKDGTTQTTAGGASVTISTPNVTVSSTAYSQTNNTTTSYVAGGPSATIALHNANNLVKYTIVTAMEVDDATNGMNFTMFRDSTDLFGTNFLQTLRAPAGVTGMLLPIAIVWYDKPGDTSAHTYQPKFKSVTAAQRVCWGYSTAGKDGNLLMLQEIPMP